MMKGVHLRKKEQKKKVQEREIREMAWRRELCFVGWCETLGRELVEKQRWCGGEKCGMVCSAALLRWKKSCRETLLS
jgi:hypothetical protein